MKSSKPLDGSKPVICRGGSATMVGVSKADSVHEIGLLEHAVRNVLNRTAPRRFAVLDPIRVVIENYPEGQVEEMDVVNNPEDPSAGTRQVAFGRELWIERDDFMEEPPPKFFRLAPGREVRLRSAYFVTCREVVKDAAGAVVELRCIYDPATRGRDSPDGRDLFEDLNPESETVGRGAFVEPALTGARPGETVQFERLGYFAPDPDSTPGHPVFNRTLTLKDTWAKVQAQGR